MQSDATLRTLGVEAEGEGGGVLGAVPGLLRSGGCQGDAGVLLEAAAQGALLLAQGDVVQPRGQHQTGGQPGQGPELGAAEEGDHPGGLLLPDAGHDGLGEPLRRGDLLQPGHHIVDHSKL